MCALASWSIVQVERLAWVPAAAGRKGEAPPGVEKVIGRGKGKGSEPDSMFIEHWDVY